jgi:hypothetical protein
VSRNVKGKNGTEGTRVMIQLWRNVNVGAQETSYGQSVVSIELVLFYKGRCQQSIYICSRHSFVYIYMLESLR